METRTLGKDVAEMGRETGEMLKDKAQGWAAKAKATGADAVAKAKTTYHVAQDKAIAGARITDATIRSRPYETMGMAFAFGLILGWLLSRD